MTLVDSSVWIDFLRDRDTPETAALSHLLLTEQIKTADLVLTEVLRGVTNDRAHEKALRLLSGCGILVISNHAVAVQAALNYRLLRRRGHTVRKTIDALIATRCILDRIPLLYSARDFEPFVKHLGLRSALDLYSGVTR